MCGCLEYPGYIWGIIVALCVVSSSPIFYTFLMFASFTSSGGIGFFFYLRVPFCFVCVALSCEGLSKSAAANEQAKRSTWNKRQGHTNDRKGIKKKKEEKQHDSDNHLVGGWNLHFLCRPSIYPSPFVFLFFFYSPYPFSYRRRRRRRLVGVCRFLTCAQKKIDYTPSINLKEKNFLFSLKWGGNMSSQSTMVIFRIEMRRRKKKNLFL